MNKSPDKKYTNELWNSNIPRVKDLYNNSTSGITQNDPSSKFLTRHQSIDISNKDEKDEPEISNAPKSKIRRRRQTKAEIEKQKAEEMQKKMLELNPGNKVRQKAVGIDLSNFEQLRVELEEKEP